MKAKQVVHNPLCVFVSRSGLFGHGATLLVVFPVTLWTKASLPPMYSVSLNPVGRLSLAWLKFREDPSQKVEKMLRPRVAAVDEASTKQIK